MQIGLHDIRELGYSKIFMQDNIGDVFTQLYRLDYKYKNINIRPYSFLSKLSVEDSRYEQVQKTGMWGMLKFIKLVNAFLPYTEVTNYAKTKFRYNYEAMWSSIQEATTLTDSAITLLSDLALKIPFIDEPVPMSIVQLYNTIFVWYCITATQDDLLAWNGVVEKNKKPDLASLLRLMICNTSEQFCSNILGGS